MRKGCCLNRPHLDHTLPEGSLKDQTLIVSPPQHQQLPFYNMSLNDTEKPNSELDIKEQILAPNPTTDTEMISVDQTMPVVEGSELGANTDLTPVIGDNTQMTQDQLTLITESVWQWLDAKHSQDSTECEDAIKKLFELQTRYSDLSDKHKATTAKLMSLKKEHDTL